MFEIKIVCPELRFDFLRFAIQFAFHFEVARCINAIKPEAMKKKKKLKSSQFGVCCWVLSQVIVQLLLHTKKRGKNQYSGPSIYVQSQ